MTHRIWAGLISCFLLGTPVFADITAGKAALEKGDFDAAIVHFKSDIKNIDTAFEANWLTGRAFVSRGDSKSALDYLEKAVEADPNHADAQYWWGAANGELAEQASIFSAPGYAKACRKAFETAVALDPEHMNAREGLIEYYLGAPGFLGGDKDKALDQANEVLKRDRLRGFASLATVYIARDEPDRALGAYGDALEENPHFMGAFLRRGLLYRQMEKYDDALSDFEALVIASNAEQEDKKQAELLGSLGQYFFGAVASKSGLRADDGISALEKYFDAAIFDHPLREGYGQYYLATLYFKQGNFAKAKQLVEAAGKGKKDKDLKKMLKKLKKKLRKT